MLRRNLAARSWTYDPRGSAATKKEIKSLNSPLSMANTYAPAAPVAPAITANMAKGLCMCMINKVKKKPAVLLVP